MGIRQRNINKRQQIDGSMVGLERLALHIPLDPPPVTRDAVFTKWIYLLGVKKVEFHEIGMYLDVFEGTSLSLVMSARHNNDASGDPSNIAKGTTIFTVPSANDITLEADRLSVYRPTSPVVIEAEAITPATSPNLNDTGVGFTLFLDPSGSSTVTGLVMVGWLLYRAFYPGD